MAGREVGLTFVPHLTSMIRRIHATLYGRIAKDADFQSVFEGCYVNEPFVDVLPAKSYPETRSVWPVDVCRLAVHRTQDGDAIAVLSVIDNLIKGAASRFVLNMKVIFGLGEALGLCQLPLLP